jgi:uncharacterized pyridoxamine 5'-phosphate oxidase family protein
MPNSPDSKKRMLEIVRNVRSATVATVSADGTPSIAPIFFILDDDFSLYFVTKTDTQKFKNISACPDVAFCITEDKEMRTLQGRGTAHTLLDNAEVGSALARLIGAGERFGPWLPPIAKIEAGQYAMVKITPSWLRFADFSAEHDGTKEYFEEIVP